jgi:hypothetical protein
MKNATLRLLTVVGSAVALSVVGIAPANAAPVVPSAAVQKAVVSIPTVSIKTIPNSTLPSTSARRLVAPIWVKGAGATPISARIRVATTSGKLITSSATRINLGVGSYKITTNIYYSYMQGGRKLFRTVSATQVLGIGLAKPKPVVAPTVKINTIPNSTVNSATAVRNVRPSYVVPAGAKAISARLKVVQGSKVITESATNVNLKPGTYNLTSSIRYSYAQSGKTFFNTATKTQPLTISYTRPVTQPVAVPGSFEKGVIDAFNVYRAKAGMPALKTDSSVNAFNTRWVSSNFTTNESMDNISPYIMFAAKVQSNFSPGLSPSTFAASVMNQAGGKEIIYRPYVTHISVVKKDANGGSRVGVTFAGIHTP